MKKFSIICLYLICCSFFGLLNLHIALAEDYDFEFDSGLIRAGSYAEYEDAEETSYPETTLPQKIGTIIGAILNFLGVIFLILMIYGGFMWMTAAGNEEQISKAQKIITAAIIGVVIVASAYAITAYVGSVLE